MILAHGPLGYLTAYITKRWWKADQQSPRHRTILYWVACIAGIFPDSDLFYIYFVNDSVSHRQLITHSLLLYVGILIIGIILVRWRGFSVYWIAIVLFGLGGMSHVITDALVGFVALFEPFNSALYGLPGVEWYQQTLFTRYSLVTMLGLELAIFIIAGYTFVRQRWYIIMSSILFIGVAFLAWFVNEHRFTPNGVYYYGDIDNDDVITAQDLDSDGDGIRNIEDTDIDNDGEDNAVDMLRQTYEARGGIYDYTEGSNLEIPLRLGFVTSSKLIERMYANVGIFFGAEMADDYTTQPQGYIGKPTANEFSEDIQNWKTWLQHRDQLLSSKTQPNEYDIVFFKSGHVALFTRIDTNNDGVYEDVIFEAHSSHFFIDYVSVNEVILREGPVEYYGRLLPKSKEYQY